MKIPKIITVDKREYIFVEAYPSFVLYQDMLYQYKKCFQWNDLKKIQKGTYSEYKKERSEKYDSDKHRWV